MFLPVVLVTLLAWFAIFRWRRRRLYALANKLGGEKMIPIFGHLHNYVGNTEHIMDALKNSSYYALKNMGVASVWLGHKLYFVVTDPVDIEYILYTCLEKDDLHRYIRDIIGNGVVYAPVAIWKVRRKIIIPAFSPKIVDNFVHVFSEQSEILQKQLKRKVGKGKFDLWPFFSAFTLDSVCKTVMGTKVGAQENENIPLLKSFSELLNMVCKRIFHIWLQNDRIFQFVSKFTKYEYYRSIATDFVDDVIEAKREEYRREKVKDNEVDQDHGLEKYNMKTFLDLLIENSDKINGYSNLELREEVLTLTFAGTDTSATAMSFTLLLLAKYPDIQERVYQELVDIYGNSERPLVKEDLTKMVYLERVIKESLRLYPPVPFIIRKIDKEITLPSGKTLPAGSGTPISIFGVHRNKEYWGEDAEEFDPDRFSPERYNLKHPCAYIPFSSGVRNCLGYQYAMHSIKTSLSTILRRYKVTVPENELKSKIRVKIDVMQKAVNGYEVQLEERNH